MIVNTYKENSVIWLIPMFEYFPFKGEPTHRLVIGWLKYRISFTFRK